MHKVERDMDTDDLLSKDIDRLKNNDSELYALDRKRAEVMAELQADMREVKNEQKTIKADISELKENLEKVQATTSATSADVNKLKSDVKDIKDTVTQKHWQPKDIAVVITSVISLITAVTVALISAGAH